MLKTSTNIRLSEQHPLSLINTSARTVIGALAELLTEVLQLNAAAGLVTAHACVVARYVVVHRRARIVTHLAEVSRPQPARDRK